ncbi:hypothetical protein V6Z12_A10G206200 [Gossypium hirsutum]
MNAHVNGEEDDEEEIEAVAHSADASDKDDDAIHEENADNADDSCKHENWNVVAKYLTENLPLLLTSKNLKDVNDVLCMVFRSTPSSLRDFIKWIAEIQRQDDGSTVLSKEEKGRVALNV